MLPPPPGRMAPLPPGSALPPRYTPLALHVWSRGEPNCGVSLSRYEWTALLAGRSLQQSELPGRGGDRGWWPSSQQGRLPHLPPKTGLLATHWFGAWRSQVCHPALRARPPALQPPPWQVSPGSQSNTASRLRGPSGVGSREPAAFPALLCCLICFYFDPDISGR